MDAQQLMERAIENAKRFKPDDSKRIPKVGAVIEKDGKVLADGWRQAEIHAEKDALAKVADRNSLRGATVYTTLEPCTPRVRRKPEESCTSLLLDAGIKKVVIGILDPNQGVCGKGVLALQKHDIEVVLFPHELSQQIRALNEEFIRAQQTLGLIIITPAQGAQLETYKTAGKHTFKCECISPPNEDIFVFSEYKGQWYPQPTKLKQCANTNEYQFDCWFGTTGPHTVHVVRANSLGEVLISYYWKVCEQDKQRRTRFRATDSSATFLNLLGDKYIGVPISSLPQGLDSQGCVSVEVVPKPT